MSALLGISGARRNALAALCVDGQIRAACEQERLTRVRGVGFEGRSFPRESVDAVLALADRRHGDVSSYVVAERQAVLPETLPCIAVDHHQAHAATAFLTSPHARSAVLVCDSSPDRELSVWLGEGPRLTDREWAWRGRAFATLYSQCARLFDFARGQEHRLEALARLGKGNRVEDLHAVLGYERGALTAAPGWQAHVAGMIDSEQRCGDLRSTETASAVQRRIGELLLEFVSDVRTEVGCDTICLGGGLFYNTYFTTLIRKSGIFENVFVPINPGNAGVAVGATLLLAGQESGIPAGPVSPFLGPEYDSESIKATLDGCKLSYSFVSDSEAIDSAVDALTRGELVGWFQGRMEWGHRALGHRSILADPRSPYVLDNLNCFLRKRERWRSFGVSVNEDAVGGLFCGPAASPFMEYEYGLRDDRLRHVTPSGATSIRVQTVGADRGPFWTLHKRMEQATGVGALVNTSLNGFQEPIACSPLDAVRVFFGSGLDMLVMGRFILRK